MNESQIKILARDGRFLNKPLHGQVEETHISYVILSKKYAFKIKKPLKLSFLDFSTLAKRKKYCERELWLNQRFSPIYLKVLPVCKQNGLWVIGQCNGKVIDYTVLMKRLSTLKRMDKLLVLGKVSKDNIVTLAQVIAFFHSSATVISTPFNLPKARAAFNDIRTTIALCRSHLGNSYASIIQTSIAWSDAFLKIHGHRMDERIHEGFNRDVHGDLHSGNIFLYKKPILFDCIEFNDAYRHIDIINEIAFFCMDLDFYGHPGLAKMFLKAYQRRFTCFSTRDDKQLFLYYKCFRANVRAKVHALSVAQAHDAESYRDHVAAWKKYLRLMRRYLKSVTF